MACNWIINNSGEIVGVKTKNGEDSKLFKDLASKFGNSKASELYAVSQSENFKEIHQSNTEEPSSKNVVRYVAQQNESKESLTQRQIIDLQDFDKVDKQKLISTFYDDFGLFYTDVKKLVKSGMYSQYEAQTINSDINLQRQIKSSLERLKNSDVTPQESVEIKRERSLEVNSFGKLKAINPQIVYENIKETLVGIKDRNEFDAKLEELGYLNVNSNQIFEDLKQYKKAEVFIEVEGQIRQKNKTETELVLPLVAKQTDNLKVEELLNFKLDFLQRNQSTTVELLREIEQELINDGIDVIGLSSKTIDENLIDFLDVTNNFIQSPTKENTNIFATISDIFFERDVSPQTKAIKGEEDKDYVQLDTNLSEEQVYEQAGLIKSGSDNIWIKTAKENLEELYNNLRTYTEKYPKDKTLEEYVQEQIPTIEGFNNAENAEAVYLYKMYFDVQEKEKVVETQDIKNFKGDYEYLTNGFVSDFYIETLKGQHKDFSVNEKGIYLLNNDSQTISNLKLTISEDLKQYSLISKQLPDLTEEYSENVFINGRVNTLNNPQTIKKFTGKLFKLNENEVIVKDNSENFLKVGDEIYESVAKQSNLNHFIKLESNNSDYNIINLEISESNIKLEDYKYLETSPDSFISAKNYKTDKNLTDFNC